MSAQQQKTQTVAAIGSIDIHVEGGVVQNVEGLPKGWYFNVIDDDEPETNYCGRCDHEEGDCRCQCCEDCLEFKDEWGDECTCSAETRARRTLNRVDG